MPSVTLIFVRLLYLIGSKFAGFLLTYWKNLILTTCFYSYYYLSYNLHSVISWLFKPKRKSRQNVGIAILTRFPIADGARLSLRQQTDGPMDKIQYDMKHPSLFERILAEFTMVNVVKWVQSDGPAMKNVFLFLVYRSNFTSLYPLDGWFSILPNHVRAKEWYKKRVADCKDVVEPCDTPIKPTFASDILFRANENASLTTNLGDMRVYCSPHNLESRLPKHQLADLPPVSQENSAAHPLLRNEVRASFKSSVEYITVAGVGFANLLEVALRAALRANADYVIVLNPRTLNIEPKHLSEAYHLLSSDSEQNRVDVVLGISKTPNNQSLFSTFPSSGHTDVIPSSNIFSTNGLYLLGIRGGWSLTLRAGPLVSSVEWSTSFTASRIWSNLTNRLSNWKVACLRDRLEELTEVTDLLSLERTMGIPPTYFLDDTVTVIIPMGPGHPADAVDEVDDVDLIDVEHSKALKCTLEILVHNATGKRQIQVILMDSNPLCTSSPSERDSSSESLLFHGMRLRPMIHIIHRHCHNETGIPLKRGELIRYAVAHHAIGTTLVFLEPGVQLPPNWDAAIYHALQRPGVGMGCFAYRLHLYDKYIHRKSITWAINCWLASYFVNVQTRWTELPIVGQPTFIYAHYLACLGGYPLSSRALHSIDLASACQRSLGRLCMTRYRSASAGVPADFALRHGVYRTSMYTLLLATARYFGASETELGPALTSEWQPHSTTLGALPRAPNFSRHPLPLVAPTYLDGY